MYEGSIPGKPFPLLMLEFNEIPWRLLDLYLKKEGYPNLRRFFSESRTYSTLTVDTGELSPWVTWPSLHRGMGNREHGILNLGQDPATFSGTPIWEEYRKDGHSIGVFGSLQSWPPRDPGPGGFYVPDTFAHDERCIPDYIEPVQKFNLGQVRRNGRVVDRRSLVNRESLGLLKSLPRLGIRAFTLFKLAAQLLGERVDKNKLARRPIFQSVLFWDIFKSLYHPESPPAFSSFFTNHVAGIMHRYWNHVFPEDFGRADAGMPTFHRATMDFAMALVDQMLADAMEFQRKNEKLILVCATSMGQAAVHRDTHEGYSATIPQVEELMKAIGLQPGDFKPLLAMVPQVAVQIPDPSPRKRAVDFLSASKTCSEKSLFKVQELGSSLSITLKTPNVSDIQAGGFLRPADPAFAFLRWEEAGIQIKEVEAGTAYHIPEGVLAIRGHQIEAGDSRAPMQADRVKSFLMSLSGMTSSEGKDLPNLQRMA